MDSMSMYNKLKDKHSEQENLLNYDVTERLANVEIGNEIDFNVNNDILVDGNEMSAKTAFMNAYSQEYVSKMSHMKLGYITQRDNMLKVIDVEEKTRETAENLASIKRYSADNTARDEKTRNSHRKKVNKYATKLVLVSGKHRKVTASCASLTNKAELTAAEKKALKKNFMKKYELDLEVVEQEYQMNKSLLKMGGNKDVAEEDSLFRLRYTRYAKAMAANNEGIAMAERFPDLFDAEYFKKRIDKLNEKISEIGESASPELLESKKNYFIEGNQRRLDNKQERDDKEKAQREAVLIKAKIGDRLQGAIDAYIAKRIQNGSEEEGAWIRENLELDGLAEALTNGMMGTTMLTSDEHAVGMGAELFNNFDKAMELFIERYLYDKATSLSEKDTKAFRRSGLSRGNITRTVRTQLHPVRRLKNGEYVSEEDQQNDAFNRKYIDALLKNNMQARKECIEENFRMLYSFDFKMDNLERDDFFDTDYWKKFLIAKISLGSSNLMNDNISLNSRIMNNIEIAREVQSRYDNGTVDVNGRKWDYAEFISHFLTLQSAFSNHKYNVDPGTMQLANDMMAFSPDLKDDMLKELKTFAEGYAKLQKPVEK